MQKILPIIAASFIALLFIVASIFVMPQQSLSGGHCFFCGGDRSDDGSGSSSGGGCSSDYGLSCQSSANACGQVGTGTYDCNGICSATTPTTQSCPVSVSLSASPSSITQGSSSSLSWSSQYANSCTGTNFSTNGATSGSRSVSPSSSTTYTLQCSNNTNSNSTSRTVTVSVPNSAPNAPTITGPTTGAVNTSYSFSFYSTDPNGDAILYQVDWDNNGTVDETTEQVSSGTSVSRARSWSTSGAKTFAARAGDSQGLYSGWSTHTITISNPEISGSCSASPTTISIGGSSTWTAYPSGGTGSYTYSWSGTNSLSGTSQSVSKVYSTSGTKTASVVITSGGVSRTIACSNSISVSNTECSDGIDNNGNGLIDTADTLVCSSPSDPFEEAIPAAALSLSPNASIIRTGSTVTLSWSATNASSCTLTGTNGDSWSLSGSSGTRTSSALTSETTFTLRCTDLNNSPVSTSTTVRITPSFEEVLRQVPQLLASVISGWF